MRASTTPSRSSSPGYAPSLPESDFEGSDNIPPVFVTTALAESPRRGAGAAWLPPRGAGLDDVHLLRALRPAIGQGQRHPGSGDESGDEAIAAGTARRRGRDHEVALDRELAARGRTTIEVR